MSDILAVVQFPHPGGEHRPDGEWMAWNRGDHKRKYLTTDAAYIDPEGHSRQGPICFWGEWEPPSKVVHRFPPDRWGRLPRYVHEPALVRPADHRPRQNSDPLVFGEQFFYSNCRQARNNKLRRLAPGSLILFGSAVKGDWVLDTLLVVSEREYYTVPESSSLEVAEWVQTVVFEPLRCDPDPSAVPLVLYRGRSAIDEPDGPFSFTPCLPVDNGFPRFARPALRLHPKWISPNLTMAARVTPATDDEIASVWQQISDQIADHRLSRATRIVARFDTAVVGAVLDPVRSVDGGTVRRKPGC